ncbi:MAG: hypothetical protein AseanaTS_06310 [Candidatus Pelagadaptatus aseana]|uniref:glutathione S-transferase family protein n=1 Tax=Candidatus Pelagadaptatus aseana TaxID=3120508 RepID=UPI0039B2FBCB
MNSHEPTKSSYEPTKSSHENSVNSHEPDINSHEPNIKNHEPFDVYLADVSYFSGKWESYLRYKQIPFNRIEMDAALGVEIYRHTGMRKVPAVKTARGEWLKDTTPMIDWFERQYPQVQVVPGDPVQRFVSKLVEDYADEWCWRSAMYHRWRSDDNAGFLGHRIGREVFNDWPMPVSLAGKLFKYRQRRTFMWGDGLDNNSESYIHDHYPLVAQALTDILQDQPFLLGDKPSLVDFAFMGPFFRHYFCDPVPAKIMRDQFPQVLAWVTRVWSSRASRPVNDPEIGKGDFDDFSASGWHIIFKEIVQIYLPYLQANAKAFDEGKTRFDFSCDAVHLKKLPVVQYRCYCLQMLEQQYQSLSEPERQSVDQLFAPFGELLLNSHTESGLVEELQLPLKPRGEIGLREKFHAFFVGTPWDMIKK